MKSKQKEMLLVEYQEIASNLRTFWNKRMTILGLGITLMGILITQSVAGEIPVRFIYDLCLILLLFTIIRIFGSLSKPMYLFTFRMKEISKQFEISDFWNVWQTYVVKNPMESGTATFYIISKYFNWFVLIYVISINSYYTLKVYKSTTILNVCLFSGLVVLCIAFFFINNKAINSELNPKNFHPDLIKQWSDASIKKVK